jgi:hypothetical protein
LTADLSFLTHDLERRSSDLKAPLRSLADTVRRMVESYLGLTITLSVDGHPVIVTAMDRFTDPGDIAASARLPLAVVSGVEPGCVIVFYASNAGAFVDLAADLGYALGVQLVLDDHLPAPPLESGVVGLSDMSQVNQALGILLGRRYTLEGARTELLRLVRLGEITLVPAAQRLIQANQRPPGPASIPA